MTGGWKVTTMSARAGKTETVAYHVRLMAHHGLLDVSQDVRDMNGGITIAGITWDGQEVCLQYGYMKFP